MQDNILIHIKSFWEDDYFYDFNHLEKVSVDPEQKYAF